MALILRIPWLRPHRVRKYMQRVVAAAESRRLFSRPLKMLIANGVIYS